MKLLHLFKTGLKTNSLNQNVYLLVKHFGIVLFFTIMYYISEQYLIYEHREKEITDKMNLMQCFHFSLVTHTTVGYGYSYPTNIYSRMINILQLLTIFYGIFITDDLKSN